MTVKPRENSVVSMADHTKLPSPPNPKLAKLRANPDVKAGMEIEGFRLAIAYQLRLWRKSARLTQAQLADKMHTTQKQISRMESCTSRGNNLTIDTVGRFAHACGMKILIQAEPISPIVTTMEDACASDR